MLVCKQCAVELDDGMEVCPLCDTSVIDGGKLKGNAGRKGLSEQEAKPGLLKHVLWQISCVLLLSGIAATLIINLSVAGRVTWSMYPVIICLIILSYSSLVALWDTKVLIQLLTGWIISSILLAGAQSYTGESWPLGLAFPMLSAINVISMLLILILTRLKVRGLNILAIVCVAVAVICILIEVILSLYFQNQVQLGWSVVVSACLLPVTAAIIFMYFRTRNNNDLQKIFHT